VNLEEILPRGRPTKVFPSSPTVMADHDREGLLNILETQGRQFLNSFSLLNSFQTKRKRTDDDGKGKGKVSKVTQDEESEEWLGFGKDIFVCSGSEDGGGEDDGQSLNSLHIFYFHGACQDLNRMTSLRMFRPAHPTLLCSQNQEQSLLRP
jgi:hypothetical protein